VRTEVLATGRLQSTQRASAADGATTAAAIAIPHATASDLNENMDFLLPKYE
jgi:hypothetical protein